MAIDIAEKVAAITAAKTADADYTGKKISELPDMVAGSATELKKRFDAALLEVLDPKYRALVEAVVEALNELASQSNAGFDEHKHDAQNITSGTLGIERGGTGGTSEESARLALGVYSMSETRTQISNLIAQHNGYSSSHSMLLNPIRDRLTAVEGELDGVEEALAAL